MFSHADNFKQTLDEALWPLVDWVISQVGVDDWLAWSDVERRDLVQAWMDKMYAP